MKATMDLTGGEAIVTGIVEAGGIVVDHGASRLYSVDYGNGRGPRLVMEKSDLHGQYRYNIWQISKSAFARIYSMVTVENYLYWINLMDGEVYCAMKNHLATTDIKLAFKVRAPYRPGHHDGFIIGQAWNQPTAAFNPCET